jgi:hypothetical protein
LRPRKSEFYRADYNSLNRSTQMDSLTDYIHRYTQLEYAEEILKNARITLVNPYSWGDKNEFNTLEIYKQGLEKKSIYAFCATISPETYHHWNDFARGGTGVRVEFNRERLQAGLKDIDDCDFGEVEYMNVDDLRDMKLSDFPRLPFVKRKGYGPEKEYRIVVSSQAKQKKLFRIALFPDCVSSVVVSPKATDKKAKEIRDQIRAIKGFEDLKVYKSGLVESKKWLSAGDQLLERYLESKG